MPNASPAEGWRVSEVERLAGLPRRDIQRACYEGQGGVGLLSPQDSSWGRRTYTLDDVARLFVVAELKREGRSLPEARQAFDEARGADGERGWRSLLDVRAARLSEQAEDVLGRLLRAEALRLALDGRPDDVGRLVGQRVLSHAAVHFSCGACQACDCLCAVLAELASLMEKGVSPRSHEATEPVRSCMEACAEATGADAPAVAAFADDVLGVPGIDLAIELWLAPGAHAYAVTAWEQERPEQTHRTAQSQQK